MMCVDYRLAQVGLNKQMVHVMQRGELAEKPLGLPPDIALIIVSFAPREWFVVVTATAAAAAAAEEREQAPGCDGCGTTLARLRRCRGCGLVRYCSKECQLQAWAGHKAQCKRAQKNATSDS